MIAVEALADELNKPRRRVWPYFAVATGLLSLAALFYSDRLSFLVMLGAGAAACLIVALYDRSRLTIHLAPSEPLDAGHQSLQDALELLCQSGSAWIPVSAKRTDARERKSNAGADSLAERVEVKFQRRAPKWVATKDKVYKAIAPGGEICFFPDRLVIQQGGRWSLESYTRLEAEYSPDRWIEAGAVPGDAIVVGSTWQYPNANGGPDRRFKENRELPICEYGRVSLKVLLPKPIGIAYIFSDQSAARDFCQVVDLLREEPMDKKARIRELGRAHAASIFKQAMASASAHKRQDSLSEPVSPAPPKDQGTLLAEAMSRVLADPSRRSAFQWLKECFGDEFSTVCIRLFSASVRLGIHKDIGQAAEAFADDCVQFVMDLDPKLQTMIEHLRSKNPEDHDPRFLELAGEVSHVLPISDKFLEFLQSKSE